MSKHSITAKQIVFSGVALALATVISTVIKLPSLPNGGSIILFPQMCIRDSCCICCAWNAAVPGLFQDWGEVFQPVQGRLISRQRSGNKGRCDLRAPLCSIEGPARLERAGRVYPGKGVGLEAWKGSWKIVLNHSCEVDNDANY